MISTPRRRPDGAPGTGLYLAELVHAVKTGDSTFIINRVNALMSSASVNREFIVEGEIV